MTSPQERDAQANAMTSRYKSILIVDDAKDIQALLKVFFKSEGYIVHVAGNGQEALGWLRSANVLPDVILLDLMMPVLDGYEFRAEQKKDARLNSIPVVVMTADGNIKQKTERIAAHAFLKKPFLSPELVLKTVEAFLV